MSFLKNILNRSKSNDINECNSCSIITSSKKKCKECNKKLCIKCNRKNKMCKLCFSQRKLTFKINNPIIKLKKSLSYDNKKIENIYTIEEIEEFIKEEFGC